MPCLAQGTQARVASNEVTVHKTALHGFQDLYSTLPLAAPVASIDAGIEEHCAQLHLCQG